jgi:hypothetical protein
LYTRHSYHHSIRVYGKITTGENKNMASPPKVRELNSLVTEIGSSVKPQMDLINNDIAANDAAGAAQIAGLGARKDTAFKQIEQTAQDKGQFFSGFSPNEQATYTAGTYLPALAQLQQTIAQTRSGLLGKKADINKGVFNQAFQTREGDVNKQFQYQTAQEERAFQADQANIARQFEAGENAKARAAQRSAAAAKAPQGPSTAAVVQSIMQELQTSADTGDGKYANPKAFNDARAAWGALGGKAGDFDLTFRGMANPKHLNDYLASGL